MRRANARAGEFTGRLQTYLKTYFAIEKALSSLEAYTTSLKVMAEGTALPDQQQQAGEALKQSEDAKLWANYFSRPSKEAILRLYGLEDRSALAEIAATCGSFSTTQHERARDFANLSGNLGAAARGYYEDSFKNYVDSVQVRDKTASAGIELLLADAEKRIANGLSNAAQNYAQASLRARATADDAERIANACNDMLVAGFRSRTPRCDFFGEDCEREQREVELAGPNDARLGLLARIPTATS
jgi:hypothetical protein